MLGQRHSSRHRCSGMAALLVFQILYVFLQPVDTRLDFITSPCIEDHYGQILVGTEDANIPIFDYGDEYFYNHLL